MSKKTISLIQITSMKKIPLVFFLLMSYISVGQDLTVISGGSITIPHNSYVFVRGNFTNN
jgi:hypothetical protein